MEGRGRKASALHLSETAGAWFLFLERGAGTSLKGKPASADGGKGFEAGTIVHAWKPELPGQASKAMASSFA
jgi:hypothetical protein